MQPELIFATVLIVFGVLIFIHDEAYGRFWRRTSIVRFPQEYYPFFSRCGGAMAILVGMGIAIHRGWIWISTLIYR